jgi:hypothetical protein
MRNKAKLRWNVMRQKNLQEHCTLRTTGKHSTLAVPVVAWARQNTGDEPVDERGECDSSILGLASARMGEVKAGTGEQINQRTR